MCRNFAATVTRVVELQPDVPISLFMSRLPDVDYKRALQEMKRGKKLMALRGGRRFIHAIAIVWPIEQARSFLEFTQTQRLPGAQPPRSDDAAIGHWSVMTRQQVFACLPSIVNHPDEVDSVIGKRAMWGKDKARTAAYFCENGDEW